MQTADPTVATVNDDIEVGAEAGLQLLASPLDLRR